AGWRAPHEGCDSLPAVPPARTSRCLVAALVALALGLPAGAAAAAPVLGISESNAAMFTDPPFGELGIRTTRLLIAYDTIAAARRGDIELPERIEPYLSEAAGLGVEPLVAFQGAYGPSPACRRSTRSDCRLPS